MIEPNQQFWLCAEIKLMSNNISELVRRAHEYHPRGTLYDATGLIAPLADALERLRAALETAIREAAQADADIAALQARAEAAEAALNQAPAYDSTYIGSEEAWRDPINLNASVKDMGGATPGRFED